MRNWKKVNAWKQMRKRKRRKLTKQRKAIRKFLIQRKNRKIKSVRNMRRQKPGGKQNGRPGSRQRERRNRNSLQKYPP